MGKHHKDLAREVQVSFANCVLVEDMKIYVLQKITRTKMSHKIEPITAIPIPTHVSDRHYRVVRQQKEGLVLARYGSTDEEDLVFVSATGRVKRRSPQGAVTVLGVNNGYPS